MIALLILFACGSTDCDPITVIKCDGPDIEMCCAYSSSGDRDPDCWYEWGGQEWPCKDDTCTGRPIMQAARACGAL